MVSGSITVGSLDFMSVTNDNYSFQKLVVAKLWLMVNDDEMTQIVQIKPDMKGLRDVDHLGLSQSEDRYLSQNGYGFAKFQEWLPSLATIVR